MGAFHQFPWDHHKKWDAPTYIRILPCCAQFAFRNLDKNKFSGGVEALGKLTNLKALCVVVDFFVDLLCGHRDQPSLVCALVYLTRANVFGSKRFHRGVW